MAGFRLQFSFSLFHMKLLLLILDKKNLLKCFFIMCNTSTLNLHSNIYMKTFTLNLN